MKFKFFFIGKIPSKANYKRISYRRHLGQMKPFITNTSDVLKHQREALYQLHLQMQRYGFENFPIDVPVKMSVEFFFSSRVSQRDIDNAEKFVGDILEKAGVLKRDSLIYLKESVLKRKGLKNFGEIVKVSLEPLDEQTLKLLNEPSEPEDEEFRLFRVMICQEDNKEEEGC